MGQHINTFNKGMTSDVSIIMQPQGTYRFGKNIQIISQDGNNYSVKDCLGNLLTFNINIPYATYENKGTPALTYGTLPMPILFISFPGRLIVLHTNSETEGGGYGEIGEIRYDPYGEGVQPKANSPTNTFSGYVPLYHHVGLNFSKLHKPEGFAFNENEINQRIYWSDNKEEPRVFDVADPTFTTYYVPAAGNPLSLVAGQQYMVLEGVIEHPVGSAVYYGPGLATTNVFTASTTSFTDQFGGNVPTTAKVIKYFPYQLLAWSPSRALGNIKWNSYGTGSVLCGSKQYFYRLSNPANGLVTSWSYGCAPIPVGTTNVPASSPANAYFDFAGGGTSTVTLNSGKSVKVDISNIDTNFTRIQLACAEFDQILETPRLISIVVDTLITGVSMTLEHTGGSNLGDLTLADVTLFPASILTCKTLTTDKNYNIIGNIKERSEFTIDLSAVTLSEIYSTFPVHEKDPTLCTNVLSYTDLSPVTNANPAFIIAGCQYQVTATPVTYNAVVYALNDVFTGVSGATAIVGAGSVRPCVYRNKYTTNGSVDRPDVLLFPPLTGSNESFWTYKNPAVASHKLGYWAGEAYRFGVLFYDLKGNPMYVRWIGDHTFSKIAQGGGDLATNIATGAYDYWFLNQRAIKISGLTIPASIIDQISGFSIVRADRDKRIITEGMLMQVGSSSTFMKPIAGPYSQDSNWLNNELNYFHYVSPDSLVNYPMTNYTAGSNIEGVQFINPTDYTGGLVYMKSVNIDPQMESRYLGVKAYDNVPRKQKIVNLSNVDEGQTIPNFGTGNLTFNNTTKFGITPLTTTADGACIPSAGLQPLKYGAQGGRRTILELDDAILDYGGAADYSNLAAVDVAKIICDVTVDAGSPYGGNSDTAKANTLYISTGHFQPITTAVKADTVNGGGDYTFNNIEVWGGDCYTVLVDYAHSLYDFNIAGDPAYNGSNSWGIKFPCQCNTNYELRRGRTVANNKMYFPANTEGVWYNDGTTFHPETFQYNYGYSSHGIEFAYPALPTNFSFANLFKYRIRFAGIKFPNEKVDSFRTFYINDYKDVDGQGGEINNIRTKDARVIVLQNAMTSIVPVLERQLLSGLSGAATTLGTGGVVDRYDPITSYFGNQHQHGLTSTEFGFMWFDMRRKAIVIIDLGAQTSEISKIDGLKGYFDEAFVDNIGVTAQTTPINSPTFAASSDRPLVGVGIIGVYDPKFKMTYLTFKFKNYPSADKPLARDFTIGYYHPDRIFISFFDCFLPAICYNHNGMVLASNNPKNKNKFYGAGMASTVFELGDVISDLNKEYICTTAGTIAVYATPPSGTYFTFINQTNQIWVNNQPTALGQAVAPGYIYNSFFGQIVTNELWFVVNPPTEESFSVMAQEQQGNNVYPTTMTYTAENQTATDADIRGTSVYFRYIWDKICYNLPPSSTGRVTNKYLLTKIIKKNWTTNPTVSVTAVKILQYVKSLFTLKR